MKYLDPFKKRDRKGIYFEFENEEILLEHLIKIDEKYYKFIFEEGEIQKKIIFFKIIFKKLYF